MIYEHEKQKAHSGIEGSTQRNTEQKGAHSEDSTAVGERGRGVLECQMVHSEHSTSAGKLSFIALTRHLWTDMDSPNMVVRIPCLIVLVLLAIRWVTPHFSMVGTERRHSVRWVALMLRGL